MKKVLLYDASNSGHHFLYNFTVLQALELSEENIDITFLSPVYDKNQISKINDLKVTLINDKKYFPANKQSKFQKALRFFILLNHIIREKYDAVHFLYLDSEILNIFLFKLFMANKKILGTLHWYPANKIKRYLVEYLIDQNVINSLIVHGEYTQNKFKNGEVHCITYPNFHSNSSIVNCNSNQNKIQLLAFGGLRYDKGIDILIRALKHVKFDYELLIAGQEDYFSRSDIENLIRESGVEEKVRLDLRFISDEQLDTYFNQSDIIVLPYRRFFLGQSGPLTEGVARKKIIIGPNVGEIGFTVTNYNIGKTFESENEYDLAHEINIVLNDFTNIKKFLIPSQEKYIKLLSIDNFLSSYKSVYKESIFRDGEVKK